jgi:hypothetical protein
MVIKYVGSTSATPVKPKKTFNKKQSVAKVSVQHPDKSSTDMQQVVDEKVFTQPTCNIGVQAAMTMNMGNYNSVKIGVSLHMPCLESDLDATFLKAQAWVDSKMAVIQNQILENNDNKEKDIPF